MEITRNLAFYEMSIKEIVEFECGRKFVIYNEN